MGKGATAEVYLGWDKLLSRFVAIKVSANQELLLREAKYQAMLYGKYFPVLFDCMQVGRQTYLIMEYVEGENLLQRRSRIGRYTEKEVCSIGMQVAEAMKALHKGKIPFVYGDIKPENIIMQKDGRIKVVDFGALVPLGEGKGSLSKLRGGTPQYAAPEQWSQMPDIRNDIYGLGMLLREMLLQEGVLCCSEKMHRVIERCIQKQKEKRFTTMEQVQLLCDDLMEK